MIRWRKISFRLKEELNLRYLTKLKFFSADFLDNNPPNVKFFYPIMHGGGKPREDVEESRTNFLLFH